MFIAGRRICLGQQLAQTELFIFAVTILQNFQIVLGQEEKPSLQPKVKKLVKSPENNYLVKLVAAKWAEGQSLYRLFILKTLWTSQIKEIFSWGNAPKIHHPLRIKQTTFSFLLYYAKTPSSILFLYYLPHRKNFAVTVPDSDPSYSNHSVQWSNLNCTIKFKNWLTAVKFAIACGHSLLMNELSTITPCIWLLHLLCIRF